MTKEQWIKLGKTALLFASAAPLLVWECLVWLCKQIVKLDGMLDEPLERFTVWASED
jgi:hypothetical protein